MKRIIFASFMIMTVGIFSCQKDGSFRGSLDMDLNTTVAEIVGTQISTFNGSVEQSLAVEKFDGHSPAYVIGELPQGNFKLPGAGFQGIGGFKFGVPHVDSCATVTVSGSSYPREIVVEYLSGCSMHKHDRKGKVIINLSDTITNAGAVQTITYKDFYIDDIKVEFSATLKNMEQNAAGNWVIEKSSTQEMTVDDTTYVRENLETQEWLTGFETADRKDNKYYLTGSGSVTVNRTAIYSKKITTPLLIDASCEFISSGVVELNNNGSTVVINYGDGTCDNKATVTTDGTTEEINLRSKDFHQGGRFEKHHHHKGFGGMHK